jgi:L-rhamnose mutarotase
MKTLWIICLSLCLILSGSCSEDTKKAPKEKVTRYGTVIRVIPEKLEEYKALHAQPWQGVNRKLKEVNIRNYSIYYRDGYLFSYFEYTGSDFEADMELMAQDSLTQEWWKLTDPCQQPVESAGEGVWWAPMEEVYHLD